jgi:isopentenyl phosphate kinase
MEKASNLVLLKLGGSLITDKARPLTAREGLIRQLAGEVAVFRKAHPETSLVVGHGSGSFGHAIASQYQTQNGVHTLEEWQGFAEVWQAAHQLNQIVIRHLAEAGLPVITFAPSAGITADAREVAAWDLAPLKEALAHRLIPVVLGDVVFDRTLGGTIFSTEKVFQYLTQALHPDRLLLAGIEKGVYSDPARSKAIIPVITPENHAAVLPQLSGSHHADVTGGMQSKVALMLALVQQNPGLTARIFSAEAPGSLVQALEGAELGTLITR